jgi:hypothetical protein
VAALTGATVLCGFGCCRPDEGRCAPFAGDSPVALRLPGLRFCAVLAVVAWTRAMRAVCGRFPGGYAYRGYGSVRFDSPVARTRRCLRRCGISPVAVLSGATVLCGFGCLSPGRGAMRAVCGRFPGGATLTGAVLCGLAVVAWI